MKCTFVPWFFSFTSTPASWSFVSSSNECNMNLLEHSFASLQKAYLLTQYLSTECLFCFKCKHRRSFLTPLLTLYLGPDSLSIIQRHSFKTAINAFLLHLLCLTAAFHAVVWTPLISALGSLPIVSSHLIQFRAKGKCSKQPGEWKFKKFGILDLEVKASLFMFWHNVSFIRML